MNVLQLISITKKYESRIVLNDVSTTIVNGITGIIGPNGSGKSTLLKIITGLLSPDNGTLFYEEKKINLQSMEWRVKIGYLPQEPGLYERMTAYEYLDYLLILSKWKNKQSRKERINALMEKLNLAPFGDNIIKNLSGGIRQKVAIAQALIHDPPVILFDEPTNNLDTEERNRIHDYLLEISKEKIILFIGHIIDELSRLCSRILVLDKGELKYNGKPAELIEQQRDFIKEIRVPFENNHQTLKESLKILNIGQNGNELIVHFDSRFNDYSKSFLIKPTLSEAYQSLFFKSDN
jgi:ABC-type multidrug transport system ATPase subunit